MRTALEVIATVLAGLAVFEIGLRVWNPLGPQFDLSRQWGDSPGELHMGVPDRKVALAPNKTATIHSVEFHTTVHTNSVGLRGPELDSTEDAIRLLTLGDSFVLGVQVNQEDTFQHKLGLLLTKELGHKVRVLNGGVDSYGTHQATLHLTALAPLVKPDAVLVGVTLENDLDDNLRYAADRRPRRSRGLNPYQNPSLVAQQWYSRSYLASYFRFFWTRMQVARHPAVVEQKERQDKLRRDPAILEEHRIGTTRALRNLSAKCEALDLPCFVTLIPGSQFIASETEDPVGTAVLEWMPETLETWDLTPAMLAAQKDPPPYFPYDRHWSPEGHTIAATTLAKHLAPELIPLTLRQVPQDSASD